MEMFPNIITYFAAEVNFFICIPDGIRTAAGATLLAAEPRKRRRLKRGGPGSIGNSNAN